MCGFAGYIGNTEDREKVLTDMMNTIIHRGPDSSGMFIDETAALGFRRLSIIDITSSGDQPIHNEDDTKVLVFNGEIYNYQDLRKDLIAAGHVFKTKTDSETLLHGYEEYGPDLVKKLRGMYAFCVWDKVEKTLFCARDMFGIKPFYYAQMNGCLLFASEVKALLPHPAFDKKFNEEQLGNYLSFQFVPSNETFFKGVFCLQPGHYMIYKDGKLSITRYFEPEFKGDSKLTLEEQAEEVERKKALWTAFEVGSVVKGTVRRLADFGAFVDIGGIDGLVHVTDLSWGRVKHPSDVVAPGQAIEDKIKNIDPERERVSLSYKDTQPKPWTVADEKYPVGSIVEGKVVRITTFGAFVELEPGLDGLVHISQCAPMRIAKVEDAVAVDQVVRVKVLDVNTEAKRISLSIREALADEALDSVPEVDDFAMEGDEA